jgi:phosphoserine phosphatase RsbU/P
MSCGREANFTVRTTLHCPAPNFVLISPLMGGLLSKLGFGSTPDEVPEIVQGESPSLQGADLAVAYFSSRAGGDLHEFLRVSPQRFLFGLLDVAGKREASGPVLQAAQVCFRSAAEELFSADELNESDAMIELSRRLNLEIMRAAGGVRSCPAFAGCYNEELGTVCYVNAGHTPGLLLDEESLVELPATGLPLGLFSLAPTDARIVGLGPAGSLAIVSRGVVEAESKHAEFGLDGVKSVMQAGRSSAKGLSQSILQSVQDFMHAAPKHNDVTALTLTRGN